MSKLRIQMFGELRLTFRETAVTNLDIRKVQQLLCYLLLHHDRPHGRERLATLLWPDGSAEQSRSYLRKALWQLQAALEAWGDSPESFVQVRAEVVQFTSQPDIWVDVAAFETLFDALQGKRGRELAPEQVEDLRHATDLYQGDLLEGWYDDWCLYERERLQQMYLAMLDKLMGYCEAHQAYEEGIVHGMRILRYEPALERTHQRLMRLHYLAGNRTGALRQYERCTNALMRELNVKPDAETVMLYQGIKSNSLGDGLLAGYAALSPAHDIPLRHVLARLQRLHSLLTDAQRQVQDDMRAVERALHRKP